MNKYIKNEINEKGFCIYNYISLNELFLTFKKDYLNIMLKYHKIIYFLMFILGIYIIYYNFRVISNILLFYKDFDFLFIIAVIIITIIGLSISGIVMYFFIYIFLFSKLLYRTYYFLLGSNILCTQKGIIIGKEILDNTKIKNTLKYEILFDEKLFQESKLLGTTKNIEWQFQQKSLNMKNTIKKFNTNDGDNIILSLVNIIEKVNYVYYYLGYILGIIFFGIFAVFLKIFLYFTKNKELEIKNIIQEIDFNFKKLNQNYIDLSEKINKFTSGEILNIEDFVEKNFRKFYSNILLSLKNKNKLFLILQNYIYKDFIDFIILEKYIKTNFNKPINDMICLLEDTQNKLKNQINEITSLKNTSKEFESNLKQKEIILEHQLNLIISNKLKFKNSLI